ncbi:hypothetical protein D9M71_106190 [compost metagenome]
MAKKRAPAGTNGSSRCWWRSRSSLRPRMIAGWASWRIPARRSRWVWRLFSGANAGTAMTPACRQPRKAAA